LFALAFVTVLYGYRCHVCVWLVFWFDCTQFHTLRVNFVWIPTFARCVLPQLFPLIVAVGVYVTFR